MEWLGRLPANGVKQYLAADAAERKPTASTMAGSKLTMGLLLLAVVAAAQVGAQGPAAAPSSSDASGLPPIPAERPPFFLGVATAAPQIEGAVAEDGRSRSIWDTWAAAHPENDSPNVTDDFYHRYAEDIRIMQTYGIKHFRFSVAWTRVIPDGNGSTNAAGLGFYSRLVDALLAAGIEPVVTLYHWDLPQVLQDRYGGFLNEQIVADFTHYATVVFEALGSRVTYWSTFNEPATFCVSGYGSGWHAPSLRDQQGEQGYVWECHNNVLRAHASAVREFRRLVPNGKIGMNLAVQWSEPRSDSEADRAAAERHMEFELAVWSDPVYRGDWPASVKERNPRGLMTITPELAAALRGSFDMYMLNFYTAKYVYYLSGGWGMAGQGVIDAADTFNATNGASIGPETASSWFKEVPWAFRKQLKWVSDRYNRPVMWVTENGVAVPDSANELLPGVLNDTYRINFYRDYMQAAMAAISQDNVDIQGYFCWSLLDNWEWTSGFKERFGLVYVDYANNQARHPKQSLAWLSRWFGLSSGAAQVSTQSI
ncbi:hypothetical protein WJX81_000662 [Elliptochloris bilobata]|uniref:Beta-glucosidase n=1 Tax=Elliptochloris bilobata TaxID=381761 RepID=A0AAW1RGA2_9CHLO